MEHGKISLTKEEIENKRSESTFGDKVMEEIKEFDKGNKDAVKRHIDELSRQ